MLALILAGCENPAPSRTWDCDDGHVVLYARSATSLDAGVSTALDGKCARTPTQATPARTWSLIPYDPEVQPEELTQEPGDTDVIPTTPAMAFHTDHVEHSEDFLSYRYDWGVEPGELTSIHSVDGITVLSRGAGYAAIQRNDDGLDDVFIRCTDCDVVVPASPTRLRLVLVRGTAHLCLTTTERVELDLLDSSLDVTVDAGAVPSGLSFSTFETGNQAFVRGMGAPPIPVAGVVWNEERGAYCR